MTPASLAHAVRDGLATGEFALWYQPVVELASGRLTDVEALIRWPGNPQAPSAAAVISAAEGSDLIYDVGQWVLHEACGQIADWAARIPVAAALTVSVNISPRQLTGSNLGQQIATSLAAAGLTGTSLRLEITEGLPIRDLDEAAAALEEIRLLGVRVSVDEFGTGFSTRRLLDRLPIDRIKVARSWVSRLGENEAYRDLVNEVVHLADEYELDTVGEGVETQEQRDILLDMGCLLGQGNYISPALPVAGFESTYTR